MDQFLSSASAAKRLGISAKALRVYEERGLVSPVRTKAGWRMYGPSEIARLHQILALKDLGISLSDIAKILAGGADKLSFVLALQERALATEISRLSHGLSLVQAAREQHARGTPLSIEDLVKLTKEASVLAPLLEKHFTPAELDELIERGEINAEDFLSTQEQLVAELKTLATKGVPSSLEALDLGRRWLVQWQIIAQGDERIRRKFAAFTSEALADPNISAALPMAPELYDFLARILRHLSEEARS